ncbi:Nramp family divalent metal transporter [candidate division KSB1 bacterium]
MATENGSIRPWSLKPDRLGRRSLMGLGAGSLLAALYIGTGDISIATSMGAAYGYSLWWTYFVLGLAAWALVDMSTRYFLATGKTPMTVFKEIHPVFSAYMVVTVVVCALFGSYSQWNAAALVITGLFPSVPLEVGGLTAAGCAALFLYFGLYKRLELVFLMILGLLIISFTAAAIMAGADWSGAVSGLIPRPAGPGWGALFMANAGSLINAWLILLYPYTMIEKGLYSPHLKERVNILHRARIDYGWGILAAAVVALPIMAAASSVARPFGIIPRSYMDLSVLLEPLAGSWSVYLFLGGLFAAAWTSGVAWWLGGAYALLDIYNLPIKLDSRPTRAIIALFLLPSAGLILLHLNPIYQIIVFSAFLAIVFPVVGLALLYRISWKDMGYFRWTLKNPRGVLTLLVDLFAVGLAAYIGWVRIGAFLGITM